MNAQRLPLLRTEISGNFDGGESAQLMSIRYDPNQAGDTRLRPGLNSEDLVSSFPIVIYDYKLEIATTCLAQAYQYYCDDDDVVGSEDWDPNSREFLSSLKKHKMLAGNTARYSFGEGGTLGSYSQWDRTVLSFKSKKYYSKKHREWRWAVPPIVLSKNKKNTMGWSVANVSPASGDMAEMDRGYYGIVTIKNWSQML